MRAPVHVHVHTQLPTYPHMFIRDCSRAFIEKNAARAARWDEASAGHDVGSRRGCACSLLKQTHLLNRSERCRRHARHGADDGAPPNTTAQPSCGFSLCRVFVFDRALIALSSFVIPTFQIASHHGDELHRGLRDPHRPWLPRHCRPWC